MSATSGALVAAIGVSVADASVGIISQVSSVVRRFRQLARRYRVDRRLPPPVLALGKRAIRFRAADRLAAARARLWPPVGSRRTPLGLLDGRRVATLGPLDLPIAELAVVNATEVVEAVARGAGEPFLVDREADRLVVGIPFEHRGRIAAHLAGSLAAGGWIVRWHDRGATGIVDVARLASHRRARVARRWDLFRPYAWGERATGDAAAVVLTFWEIGTSGQRELVGTRGHRRFEDGSSVTTEVIDGVTFPGRSAFPVEQDMSRLAEPVDLVITWVDGADPAWRESLRRTALEQGYERDHPSLDPARFRSRDEIRYVLRSIWAYCGWARHIYLVTAGQRPHWLRPDDRVRIVDHRQIIPDDALPTFNSHAIEASLHRIDGLAEHFVYFNDDVFVARPSRPELFFTPNGHARVFQGGAPVPGVEDAHTQAVDTAARRGRELLAGRFGRVVFDKPYHSAFPLRRSTLVEIEREYPEVIDRTRHSRFRSPDDLSLAASFGQHYGLATGASVFGRISTEYVNVESGRLRWHLDRIRLGRDLDTFCINETADAVGDHEEREALIAAFFDDVFPVAAPWEADGTGTVDA